MGTKEKPGGNHCPECKHGLGSAAWCQWCGWNKPGQSVMLKEAAAAMGCIEADRCNGRRPAGSCDECIEVAREAIKAIRVPAFDRAKAIPPRLKDKLTPRNVGDIWKRIIDQVTG